MRLMRCPFSLRTTSRCEIERAYAPAGMTEARAEVAGWAGEGEGWSDPPAEVHPVITTQAARRARPVGLRVSGTRTSSPLWAQVVNVVTR